MIAAAPLPADAQNSNDDVLLQMKQAAQRGDKARLTALLPQAQGHVLEPWAAYWEMKARLQDVSLPEIQEFLGFINGDRLHAVLLLSLMGLRPEEVCGLRWDDLDLTGKGLLDVANVRTLVEGRVVEKLAKTEAGMRTLPLPSVALAALKAWKTQQSRERLALGEAYHNAGYVSVDEGGRPIQTDALRRYTYRLMDAAGMRRVRLYDARHACLTWMANNGVPDTVVSAWAGHADLGFTKRHYVHSDPESLRVAADRLGELLGEA